MPRPRITLLPARLADGLSTRLSLSHFAPLLLLASALALLFAALLKVTLVLGSLKDTELAALREEGGLHRAMWDLDVAMRHLHDGCARGASDVAARRSVSDRAGELARTLRTAPPHANILPIAEDYLALAKDIQGGATCDVLAGAAIHTRREHLDENLTNLWVTRMQALHDAVADREEDARQLGVYATWAGLTLTVGSVILALLGVRRMVRSLSKPLVSLSETARRVGSGDLGTPVSVEGPREIRALGDELERMRQRLAQLDATKQGFLASVSHELRTPLSMIREALVLLGDGVVGALDPRQEKVLDIARRACEREIRMVSTLLDLSRFRAGSPLRPKDGSAIDVVIEAAVRDEQAEADARGVVVERVHDGPAPSCPLDPALLERALANLVRNAVAVSTRGETVTVQREVMESPSPGAPHGRVEISVSDAGPGVPAAIRESLFDAFVTHAVPKTGKALGVGLGLAMAREIARAHGGDLSLDDATAKGATFRLWIPLPARPSPAPVLEASHAG